VRKQGFRRARRRANNRRVSARTGAASVARLSRAVVRASARHVLRQPDRRLRTARPRPGSAVALMREFQHRHQARHAHGPPGRDRQPAGHRLAEQGEAVRRGGGGRGLAPVEELDLATAASRWSRKPPPPMPVSGASTKPSTSCTATAASTALPPRRRISSPASTASGWAADTMKRSAWRSDRACRPAGGSGRRAAPTERQASAANMAAGATAPPRRTGRCSVSFPFFFRLVLPPLRLPLLPASRAVGPCSVEPSASVSGGRRPGTAVRARR
jgi:hypothetical protein